MVCILWAQALATSGFLVRSMPRLGVDRVEGKNGVVTWFGSRNQIEPFGSLTYMYRSAYQIMVSEFGYGLGRCQATNTAWLVSRPPLYIVRSYLIKEIIKRALILACDEWFPCGRVKIELPLGLGPGTKLSILDYSLTCIGLHTILQVWSLGTVWKGVRPLRPLGLWANLHYVLLGHISLKSLLREP